MIGWSFGFSDVDVENSTENGMPTRAVKDLNLYEVSILDREKSPAYEGNLIMARSENEPVQYHSEPSFNKVFVREIEEENTGAEIIVGEKDQPVENIKPKIDYSEYENLIQEMKGK